MNIKKFLIRFITIISIICLYPASVSAADSKPLYADGINDGIYDIKVTSSSSMFKIEACKLTVSDGKMTAVMTLSGKGYEKLFMGTGEAAAAADTVKTTVPADNGGESYEYILEDPKAGEFSYFAQNADGKYDYAVAVEALDKELDCAAFSKKKQQWYDRTLVFESSSLPDDAIKSGINKTALIVSIVVAILLASGAFTAVKIKSKKNKTPV